MPQPAVSTAHTEWEGDLFSGAGTTTLDTSRTGTFDVDWKARTDPSGGRTNPEELLGAAHASCFSMFLANVLAQNGTPPTRLQTRAEVTFVPGTGITGIELGVTAEIEGISDEDFQSAAETAKAGCPVSQALAATPISLTASLG